MKISTELANVLGKYFENYTISQIAGGATDAKLFRINTTETETYILKSQSASLQSDYLNYKWLAKKVPVPQVIFYHQFSYSEWLCMTELKGYTLDYYKNKVDEREIIKRYAQSLKLLHSVNINSHAITQNLNKRLLAAEENLKNNLVDRTQLEPENQHHDLYALFEKLWSLKPTNSELVFTHGDYCFDNVIYDQDKLSGFIDLGNGGVADKYQDVALAVRSIKDEFSDKLVNLFYKEYGLQVVDESKLAFYLLLDEFF